MKLNPIQMRIWATSAKFLRFIITSRGIETNAKKTLAILTMRMPNTVKDIRSLNGKFTAIRSPLGRYFSTLSMGLSRDSSRN